METFVKKIIFKKFAVHKSTYPPGFYMPPHTDATPRISIIIKGEVEEKTSFFNVKGCAGTLIIKPENIVHENCFGPYETTILSISFNPDFKLPLELTSWKWIEHPKISILGIHLWLQLQKTKNDNEAIHLLKQFTKDITLLQDREIYPEHRWLATITDSLKTNITGCETIKALSKKSHLHPVYLSRAFRKKYNIAPVEFRKYIKLISSVQELSLTEKTLAAVAYDSGFSDQSHMTRIFKNVLGYTPLGFKKLVKQF